MKLMDLNRILNHDVDMAGLEMLDTWNVISEFLKYCERYSSEQGDISIAPVFSRKLFQSRDAFQMLLDSERENTSVDIPLVRLLRNPRILKAALRKTWDAWVRLHGEVDLNELLVCCSIRAVSTEATSLITDYVSKYVQIEHDKKREASEGLFGSLWDMYMKSSDASQKRGLHRLVEYLLLGTTSTSRIQSITNGRYWKRIRDSMLGYGDIGDQLVLKDMYRWRKGIDGHAILDGLKKSKSYSDVWEILFRDQRSSEMDATAKEVLSLSSALFESASKEFGARANFDSYSGISALWRAGMRRGSIEGYELWLWNEIKKALPVSLKLVADLEYYWGSQKYSSLDSGGAKQLRGQITSWARANWDAAGLCRCLSAHHPWTLHHVLFGPPLDTESVVHNLDSWRWIGSTLLKAIELDPLLVVPQVIPLFADSKHEIRHLTDNSGIKPSTGYVYTINPDDVKLVYDDPSMREKFVKAILTQYTGEEKWSDLDRDMMEQVRKQLIAWQSKGLG